MDEKFNKKFLFDNISYLLEEKNTKIGELEAAVGVSTGYISRNKDGASIPGLEFVVNVAKFFKVDIETLLMTDLRALTPTEKYILNFIIKLCNDTQSDCLDWNLQSADFLNNLEFEDYEGLVNPLFSSKTFFEKGVGEYPEEVERVVFQSKSFGNHTCIYDDCFYLNMKNNVRLYIMNICKGEHRSNDASAFAKELWIEDQFVGANNDNTFLAPYIDRLYDIVVENSKHPKIKPRYRNAIDAFMVDDWEEEIPF